MFWANTIVDELLRRYAREVDMGVPLVIRDEKTASGRVHVGSLRSASLHAIVADILTERGIKNTFFFEINDFDAMDGIPKYLDEAEYRAYLGVPLFRIPSPEPGHKNFAELYGTEYVEVLRTVGFEPHVYRASELYLSGKMNPAIRSALEKRDVVRRIFKEISGSDRNENWFPLNVVCERCGKLSSTRVIDFDGDTVSYECSSDTIDWAEGCNHTGRVSPFDGNAKLPWKLDWPAKFGVMEVHFEGGGKDHYTKGGSRDVANALSREVFGYEPPYGVFNEFFLVGGKKMSSSKGNAATAVEMAHILPPHILRLLLLKSPINRQIDFNPDGDAIPLLFDLYDRLAEKTWSGIQDDDTQLFHLAHVPQARAYITRRFLPRFSQIAFLVQMPHIRLEDEITKMKGSTLTQEDEEEMNMRSGYARLWLREYADDSFIFKLQETIPDIRNLTVMQREALLSLSRAIGGLASFDGQAIHEVVHAVKEESGLTPKEFFSAIYLVFLGKESGPKVGWFLSTLNKEFVISRLASV